MAPRCEVGIGDERTPEVRPKAEHSHHPEPLRQQANRRGHDRYEPIADTDIEPRQRGRRQRAGQHTNRDRAFGEQRRADMAADKHPECAAGSDAPLERRRRDPEKHCDRDKIEDVVDPQSTRHKHQNRSTREMHDVGARRVQHV